MKCDIAFRTSKGKGHGCPKCAKIQSVQAQHDATEKKEDAGTEVKDLPRTENVMLPF